MLTAVDARGEQLFSLGRACLGSVGLEHASPATVQALHLCGTYMLNDKGSCRPKNHLTADGTGAEMFWPILGTAVKIAQSVSWRSHRDVTLSPAWSAPRWRDVRLVAVRDRGKEAGVVGNCGESGGVRTIAGNAKQQTYDRLQALCFGR